jgi:transposase-like protein
VIQIDEARIRDHLGEMVRGSVEEALFLRHLVERGLTGVQLIVSFGRGRPLDGRPSASPCHGLVESTDEHLPKTRWQRCVVHFYRNVFSHVPTTKVREVSHMARRRSTPKGAARRRPRRRRRSLPDSAASA